MSFIITVYTSEGIVMASDSRSTYNFTKQLLKPCVVHRLPIQPIKRSSVMSISAFPLVEMRVSIKRQLLDILKNSFMKKSMQIAVLDKYQMIC